MLCSLDEIRGFTIQAEDGKIGHVEDFFFDDVIWTIRYLVVDTGPWLFGRKVLIAPEAMGEPQWSAEQLPVHLSRAQVEGSPEVDVEQPVSRQKQEALSRHYGWTPYWLGLQSPGLASGTGVTPLAGSILPAEEAAGESVENAHLRSVAEVTGYAVQATDGNAGHVEDFLAENGSWIIRYLVLNTRDWLPGRDVLVAPAWIRTIEWDTADVYVDLEKEALRSSPEYDPADPIDREYEALLYAHHNRPVYW